MNEIILRVVDDLIHMSHPFQCLVNSIRKQVGEKFLTRIVKTINLNDGFL